MSMNSGGGGRPGRVQARPKEVAKKFRSRVYDQHEYDGSYPDLEAEPA